MVVLVRLGCTFGGWLWTGDTTTLTRLGRGHRLYRCCTWVSSYYFWDRNSGACEVLLTCIGCGTKLGGSKSPTGAVCSEICSGSKCRCTGGSTCCYVDWWLIGVLLPVMRYHKCSIASNSSWGAPLWHCIAVAKFLVALMILSTGVTVGVFMEWWFYFHVSVVHTVTYSLVVLMTR